MSKEKLKESGGEYSSILLKRKNKLIVALNKRIKDISGESIKTQRALAEAKNIKTNTNNKDNLISLNRINEIFREQNIHLREDLGGLEVNRCIDCNEKTSHEGEGFVTIFCPKCGRVYYAGTS